MVNKVNGEKALAKKQEGAVAMVGDVRQGGLSSSDFEIPRILLLQDTSPDVRNTDTLKAGMFINSITKEVLSGNLIPLFAFKQYAEFTDEGKLVWSTNDRTDDRVASGLKWGNTGDSKADKPTATEFINFMVLVDGQAMPLVLSFKRTSFKIGKQFLTLTSLKPGNMYGYRYKLDTLLQQKGNQAWYVPKIVPTAQEHKLNDEEIAEIKDTAAQWKLMVGKVEVQEEEAEATPF